jgi:hypothetical protein
MGWVWVYGMTSRLLTSVLLLWAVGLPRMALAAPVPIVNGQPAEVTGHVRFVFLDPWELLNKTVLLPEGAKANLIQNPQVVAPPGFVVVLKELTIEQGKVEMLRTNKVSWRGDGYIIRGVWTVTAPADCPEGATEIRIRFPAVQETRSKLRQQAFKTLRPDSKSPPDEEIIIQLHTYPTAEDVFRDRWPTNALIGLAALAGLSLLPPLFMWPLLCAFRKDPPVSEDDPGGMGVAFLLAPVAGYFGARAYLEYFGMAVQDLWQVSPGLGWALLGGTALGFLSLQWFVTRWLRAARAWPVALGVVGVISLALAWLIPWPAFVEWPDHRAHHSFVLLPLLPGFALLTLSAYRRRPPLAELSVPAASGRDPEATNPPRHGDAPRSEVTCPQCTAARPAEEVAFNGGWCFSCGAKFPDSAVQEAATLYRAEKRG